MNWGVYKINWEEVEEFGSVHCVDSHCSCPSSSSHAVTLPTPSLISPISGFSFFTFCVCVCVCVMSDWPPLFSPSHGCSSVVNSDASFSNKILFFCSAILRSCQRVDITVTWFLNPITFIFEFNPAVVKCFIWRHCHFLYDNYRSQWAELNSYKNVSAEWPFLLGVFNVKWPVRKEVLGLILQ